MKEEFLKCIAENEYGLVPGRTYKLIKTVGNISIGFNYHIINDNGDIIETASDPFIPLYDDPYIDAIDKASDPFIPLYDDPYIDAIDKAKSELKMDTGKDIKAICDEIIRHLEYCDKFMTYFACDKIKTCAESYFNNIDELNDKAKLSYKGLPKRVKWHQRSRNKDFMIFLHACYVKNDYKINNSRFSKIMGVDARSIKKVIKAYNEQAEKFAWEVYENHVEKYGGANKNDLAAKIKRHEKIKYYIGDVDEMLLNTFVGGITARLE